ncbi:hypothetical protein EON65_43015 [archaeon]|nr:MAG: hypothetical protein EON65_43015 [archaeon]
MECGLKAHLSSPSPSPSLYHCPPDSYRSFAPPLDSPSWLEQAHGNQAADASSLIPISFSWERHKLIDTRKDVRRDTYFAAA